MRECHFAGLCILVAEGDLGCIDFENGLFAENTAIQIAREILQGWQSFADVFDVRYPVFGKVLRDGKTFFVKPVQQLAAKEPGNDIPVNTVMAVFIEARFMGAPPLLAAATQYGPPWH